MMLTAILSNGTGRKMLHEAGEDVADLIHKGYIKVGDKVNRKGPPGVTPVSWKWK